MGGRTGYSLLGYGDMITDGPRMDAYAQALRRAVQPGCTLLDIGAGTGIFSLLACQLGAGSVHAIEPDDAVQVAQTIAAANGYADQITFHQALSTAITLPSRADVIVSDLRGILPLFQHHIPAIVDARQRLLAPGGQLIPQQDTIWTALVEAPDLYKSYAEPWTRNEYGLDMRAGQQFVVNTWRKVHLKPEQLLVTPQLWMSLDYATVENPDVAGALTWTMDRVGTAHGLAVWFDTLLSEDIGFSNAPGQPELIYGQAFFPLQEPVILSAGDRIEIKLQANLVGDDYTWRWDTHIADPKNPGRPKANFKQSTFYGAPLSPTQLRKKSAHYIPTLKEEGQLDRLILNLMDSNISLDEIADQLLARFPDRYADWQDALAYVGNLSQKYSR